MFPLGDWYGNLRPGDVPKFLDHITSSNRHEPMWEHWRGRMGLSQDMQVALHRAATHPEAEATGDARFSLAPIGRASPERPKHEIKFVSWDGKEITVRAKEGKNLMQVAKDAGVESVEGICGGNLEASTPSLCVFSILTLVPP